MSEEIGHNIRSRRKALGLSLESLARRSGVSATMLSEVERSVKNPTVKLAYQIAQALGCSLSELVGETPARSVVVQRADELMALVDSATGIRRAGATSELLNHRLELAWYTLPPATSTGEMAPNRPGLIEQITVVSGRLDAVLGGEIYRLEARDSVTYGVQTTDYRNPSTEAECVFLLLSDSSRVS